MRYNFASDGFRQLVITELFRYRCYGWCVTSESRLKIGVFQGTRSVWPKISGRGRPPPIILPERTRWMVLLYGVRILAVDYFVLSIHAFVRDRQANGQTDRHWGDSKTVRIHSQSHGKNHDNVPWRDKSHISYSHNRWTERLYAFSMTKCTNFNIKFKKNGSGNAQDCTNRRGYIAPLLRPHSDTLALSMPIRTSKLKNAETQNLVEMFLWYVYYNWPGQAHWDTKFTSKMACNSRTKVQT